MAYRISHPMVIWIAIVTALLAIAILIIVSTESDALALDDLGSALTDGNHRSGLGFPINVTAMSEHDLDPTTLSLYYPLVASDLDGDTDPELYFTDHGYLQRYCPNNDTYQSLPLDMNALPIMHDVDADGIIEIIYYDFYNNTFRCVDGRDFHTEWKVVAGTLMPDKYGMWPLVPLVIELDNGTNVVVIELAVNKVACYSGTGNWLWEKTVNGTDTYPRLSVGDLDRDGRLELAVVTYEERGMIYTNYVTICDLETGKTLRQWKGPTKFHGWVTSPPLISDVDIRTEGLEIVIGDDHGVIWVISGMTATTIWSRTSPKPNPNLPSFETIQSSETIFLISAAMNMIEVINGTTGELIDQIDLYMRGLEYGDITLVEDVIPTAPGDELCFTDGATLMVYNPLLKSILWRHQINSDASSLRYIFICSPGQHELALHIFGWMEGLNRTEHHKYSIGYNNSMGLTFHSNRRVLYPNIHNNFDIIELVGLEKNYRSMMLEILCRGIVSSMEIGPGGIDIANYEEDLLIANASFDFISQRMIVAVDIIIDWGIDPNSTFDMTLSIIHSDNSLSCFQVKRLLSVEKCIMVQGNLSASDENGAMIKEGQWITDDVNLTFSGLAVHFRNSTLVPDPRDITIDTQISDREANRIPLPITGSVLWKATTPHGIVGDLLYTITIVSIHTAQSMRYDFKLRVDGLLPSFTGFFPEDDIWLSNTTVMLGCLCSDGNGSGVSRIDLMVNKDGSTNGEWVPATLHSAGDLGTEAISSIVLVEGDWHVTWRMYDLAGNGPVLSGTRHLHIDTTEISFDGFSPTGWTNTTLVNASIVMSDNGGSGVDLATVSYCYSTNGLYGFHAWTPMGLTGTEMTLRVSTKIELKQGRDNIVRFRCSDVAGNERTTGPYWIHVDTTPPIFSECTPPSGSMVDNIQPVNCTIIILDGLSGVDVSEVMYRSRLDGGEYSEWLHAPIKVLDNGTFMVSIKLKSGYSNYIQWKATDLAGSGSVTSPELNIRINRPPRIDDLIPHTPVRTMEGARVSFSASISDPDGDTVSVEWECDGTLLSDRDSFNHSFVPGTHEMILKVDDAHGNLLERRITINADATADLKVISQDGYWILIIILVLSLIVGARYVVGHLRNRVHRD